MTSKEALEKIKRSMTLTEEKMGIPLFKEEWFEAVEEDLEMLELIVSHKVDLQYIEEDYDSYIFTEDLICPDIERRLTKEQFEKIKELLQKEEPKNGNDKH